MAGSISTLGLGSGIDLQGILEKLKAADQVPVTGMKTRQLQYKDQLAEYKTVNSKFLAVKNKAFDLTLNDTFDAKSVTSSQEGVLSATANSSSTMGTFEVAVTNLAKKNSWQSSGVASSNVVIASAAGNFTYTVNGQQTTVAVTENMTLQQLADALNEDENNQRVTATIMDDGTGTATAFHLVLVSDETGEANAITIDQNETDVTLSEIQAAGTLDARLSINGIQYQRTNNTVDDILIGITLNLKDIGASTIKVSPDTDSLKEKLLGLVEAYNDVLQEISTNSTYDPENQVAGTLCGVSTFRSLVSQLDQTLVSSVTGLDGLYQSLGEIGLTFEKDGTVSFDETMLDEALREHLDDVKTLLIGDEEQEIDGIAMLLNDQLREITKASGGLIASENDRVQTAIDRLDEQIEQATERLDARYEILTRQFVRLDQLMSSLQIQGDYLASQFQSLKDLWMKND